MNPIILIVCSFSFVSGFVAGSFLLLLGMPVEESAPMARFGGVMIRQLQFVGGFCSVCLVFWFDRHSNPYDDIMDDTMHHS